MTTRFYTVSMLYDPERSRAAVRAIMAEEGISAAAWSQAAGFSKNQLGEFLRGSSDSLKVGTAVALADAVGRNPLELMGLSPVLALALPEATVAVALAEIQAATTKSDEAGAQMANAEKLLAALARSMAATPLLPARSDAGPQGRPMPRK